MWTSVIYGNRHWIPASIKVSFQSVENRQSQLCVWISSFLWVKMSEFELIWHDSSHSQFHSWKRGEFELIIHEHSWSSKFEFIQHFGLLQLWISSTSSSFGVQNKKNLSGLELDWATY